MARTISFRMLPSDISRLAIWLELYPWCRGPYVGLGDGSPIPRFHAAEEGPRHTIGGGGIQKRQIRGTMNTETTKNQISKGNPSFQ